MQKWFSNRNLFLIIVLLILIIFFILHRFQSDEDNLNSDLGFVEVQNQEMPLPEELMDQEKNKGIDSCPLFVDIKGAVVKPGVYQLEENSRVLDAIEKAGGFLADADQMKINLAARVVDEMVIYVPKIGEQMVDKTEHVVFNNTDDGKIDINRATKEELEQLPGIGPSKAASIISYREENGFFKTIEELINVTGIGEKSFALIKDHIKVR
ncbi:helix-hairpin-helix domain-containing protein [Calidifontibacillus erzurumensis]|nr:helix-hairpin-helix domain-containing protein [Calidifontibacillus erzurumensis]